MTAKTNKSFTKRLKITKKGKVLKRGLGQNHFRAKKRRKKELNLKKLSPFRISSKQLGQHIN